ncbi:HdeD family acid-resistance protein [Desulfatitalea alkaliphila]|uniref:HdeD family acid-resistance protein n=1 Tax=Desulfatitalea alkaliphila TaxID=2929485 RepID=A0AA41R1G0_9BACT|nr:HdeD family acid-resistance protein [Desulfatitalea alkaliphila]MCJ8498995.1 HdeD family acid-resistance protein [Desulfatitalea alkaliphila]
MSSETLVRFTEIERSNIGAMAKWFKTIGVVMVIIGLLAVILPHIATITVQILIGMVLLIAGVLNLTHANTIRKWRSVTWEILLSVLFLISGFAFIAYPIRGAFALTGILGIIFIFLGILKIQSALAWRDRPGWGWILFSGLMSILLGVIILIGLPGTALWAIGLILGIDLIFSGVALLAVGSRLTSLI